MKHDKRPLVFCPECGSVYHVAPEQAPEHRRMLCIACSQDRKTIAVKLSPSGREQPQERIHE